MREISKSIIVLHKIGIKYHMLQSARHGSLIVLVKDLCIFLCTLWITFMYLSNVLQNQFEHQYRSVESTASKLLTKVFPKFNTILKKGLRTRCILS